MANIIVGFDNQAETGTLSGGDWMTTLPLTNLQQRALYKLARSSDAATTSTTFDVDFGTGKVVTVFALVKHNLSTSATARLIGAEDDAFTTVVYDSGADQAWPSASSLTLEWEDDNFWLGTPTQYQIAMFGGILLWVIPTTIAQYWRVEIDDTTNADGYVEFGRLFVSKDFSPTVNAAYDLTFDVEDSSEILESYNGTEHYNVKKKKREVSFDLDVLTEDDAFGRWFNLMLGQGTTGEVLFIYDHEDATYYLARSFLGRMSKINSLKIPYYANWTAGATIVETV